MQMVTVAIADTNPERRAKIEQLLQEGPGIKVLTDILPEGADKSVDDQYQHQAPDITIADIVQRIGRVKPRILFTHLDPSTEHDLVLLQALHRECPDTLVLLLTDKSIGEELIIEALAVGARGCLSHEAEPFHFQKAVRLVDRGEIWVTRTMLGKIMDKVLH
ncbi:MAG: response regulator transcription factor [Nitrosospira sp.]|nr:response regulator transcription factor [Nitrosospira sp.]